MKFDVNRVLARRELMSNTLSPFGFCNLFSELFRLLVNVFVLALVLTYIDTHFGTLTVYNDQVIKSNAITAISGLLALRVTFLIWNSYVIAIFASALLSEKIYSVSIRAFPMIVSACVVFVLGKNHVEAYGIVFNYPIATILGKVFIVLSLRSSFASYGFSCGGKR